MATNESLVLGGVEQNSNVGDFVIIDGSLSMNPPRKKGEWVTGADADGAALVRDPLFENRIIEYDLRVRGQSTTDGALGKIAVISDKLEEAERQEDGLPLVWTPAGGTKSVTFRVLSGEITELPITRQGDGRGWFRAYPMFHVVLTCKPFGYGTEVVGTAVTSSAPVVTTTVAGVTGDVPAEGRLIVTDAVTGGAARRHVEWGLEQRHYNSATSLLIDSDSLVTSGFAGTQATRAGAYDPDALGNNVIYAPLLLQTLAVCGTGNLSHTGTFRVKARVMAEGSSGTRARARLSWQVGDGPFSSNPFVLVPVPGSFVEIDLGMITVPETALGTHRWTGRIEAYSETVNDALIVDYLVLIPTGEGYGKARATFVYSPGVVNARDEFTDMAIGAVLNGRVAPSGGTWVTSGATGEFFGNQSVEGGGPTVTRVSANDATPGRLAILGSTNYTDSEALIRLRLPAETGDPQGGPIVRYVDNGNYAYAAIKQTNDFVVEQVVAGVPTRLFAASPGQVSIAARTWYAVRLTAYASGRFAVAVLDANGVVIFSGGGFAQALAAGGALASGKPGFYDYHPGSTGGDRFYDNFAHAIPAAEPIAIHSGQSLEVRHNDTLREDSSGTYWGRPQSYRGSRFLVPPAGDEVRTSRVLVKARRNDVESAADDQIADSTTVQVNYTPRFVVVPR